MHNSPSTDITVAVSMLEAAVSLTSVDNSTLCNTETRSLRVTVGIGGNDNIINGTVSTDVKGVGIATCDIVFTGSD